MRQKFFFITHRFVISQYHWRISLILKDLLEIQRQYHGNIMQYQNEVHHG